MRKLRIGRTVATLLAVGMLVSACGGGEGDDDTGEGATVSTDSSATSNVVVQMTGLLLIAPPASGNELRVYLPKPRNLGPHAARLGFVVPQGVSLPANFCDNAGTGADTAGICYVNMEKWTLGAFGAGGSIATTTLANFPAVQTSGLANVTELTGGDYKPFPARADKKSHPRVTFLSGHLVDTLGCKLAQWTYAFVKPGETQPTVDTVRLANVVVWEMKDLLNPTLMFVHGNDTVPVPLPPGETRLLLAHIPIGDLPYLPPGEATVVNPSPHGDFGPFYDILSKSNTETDSLPHISTKRTIPTLVTGDTVPCRVTLGTGTSLIDGTNSMATYACIPAWGGG